MAKNFGLDQNFRNGARTNYIIVINDLFGNLFVYDSKGKLIRSRM